MLRRSERHILWPNPAEILVFSKGLAHFYLLQLAGRSKSGSSWSAVLWLHIMRVTSLARLAPTDAWSLKSKLTWQILCNPNLRGNYHRLQGGVVTSIKRRKNKKQGYFYPQSGQTIAALWSAFLISYSSQMIYFFDNCHKDKNEEKVCVWFVYMQRQNCSAQLALWTNQRQVAFYFLGSCRKSKISHLEGKKTAHKKLHICQIWTICRCPTTWSKRL